MAWLTGVALLVVALFYAAGGWDFSGQIESGALAVRHPLRVPTLVFHGDLDAKVPLSTSRALRAAHPKLVELVTIHGADHVETWNVDPAAYDRTLRDFLTQ